MEQVLPCEHTIVIKKSFGRKRGSFSGEILEHKEFCNYLDSSISNSGKFKVLLKIKHQDATDMRVKCST